MAIDFWQCLRRKGDCGVTSYLLNHNGVNISVSTINTKRSLPTKMEFLKVLSVVAFLASFCDALYYRTDTPCDFTGISIDDEVLSRLTTRLPEGLESGPEGLYMLFPGFEVGRQTFDGLSKLQKFGPTIPYCANGTRMVQADFFSDDDTHFWSPWKTCSGDEGRVVVRARFTRFTLQFRVVDSPALGVKSRISSRPPCYCAGCSP
uniref:Uncharacterized protein n=1 Tax=Rhipicephalus microplus TaxID=6941 RepID=A0A6G5A2B8_RHIMP